MEENATSTDQSLLIGGGEDGDWMDLQITGDVVAPCLAAQAAWNDHVLASAVSEQISIRLTTGNGALAQWPATKLRGGIAAGRVRKWRSGDLWETEMDLPAENVLTGIAALQHFDFDPPFDEATPACRLLRAGFLASCTAWNAYTDVALFATEVLRLADVPWAVIGRKLGRPGKWLHSEISQQERWNRSGLGEDEIGRRRRSSNVSRYLANIAADRAWQVPLGVGPGVALTTLTGVADVLQGWPRRPASWLDRTGNPVGLQFDYAIQARTAEMGVSPGNAVTA